MTTPEQDTITEDQMVWWLDAGFEEDDAIYLAHICHSLATIDPVNPFAVIASDLFCAILRYRAQNPMYIEISKDTP